MMISRALYKQSWKANGILWGMVSLVSCFVLVVIMLLIGGDGLGELTVSFSETAAKASITTQIEKSAMNYYRISSESIEYFDKAFLDNYVLEIMNNPTSTLEEKIEATYLKTIDDFNLYLDQKIKEIDPLLTIESNSYIELSTQALMVLNPDGALNPLYEMYEPNSAPSDYDILTLISSIDMADYLHIMTTQTPPDDLYDVIDTLERIEYRKNRVLHGISIFSAGVMTSDEVVKKIIESLSQLKISKEDYIEFGFTYMNVKNLAHHASITYDAKLHYELSLLDPADIDYNNKVIELKNELNQDISKNFLNELPESFTNMLSEFGNQDSYAQVLDSMYYKIVGMLIAIVYIIMVSVSLISTQVETGSMAYILSSGTKRKTIAFTQSIFLITSTLFLFIFTTIVAVVCYMIKTPVASEITIEKILYFGASTFSVAFAFCGINFLSSSIFNRSRQAMAIGGGITVLSLICTILGMFGSQSMPSMMRIDVLNYFNYFSIISLFDGTSIIDGTWTFLWKMAILFGIGVIGFIIGSKVFTKKDLPL